MSLGRMSNVKGQPCLQRPPPPQGIAAHRHGEGKTALFSLAHTTLITKTTQRATGTLGEANWFDKAASTSTLISLFLACALMIRKIRHQNWVFTHKSWPQLMLGGGGGGCFLVTSALLKPHYLRIVTSE